MSTPVKDNAAMPKRRRKRGGLSTGKKVAISILLGLYVLVLAATSLVVFYRPTLEREKMTYYVEVTDSDGNVVETQVVENPPIDNVESYNILILGHDRTAMLTDVFMIVNIDNTDNSITVMQIPRDTWFSNGDGYMDASDKINALFARCFNYHRYTDGMTSEEAYDAALKTVTENIEKSLFINIDYSVIMDLDGFTQIVDTLGGVEMYIEHGIYYDYPGQGYISISPGYQTLTGKQAEAFVRFRAGYSTADLGRQNAQKQFLVALLNTAKSKLSVDKLPDIADAIVTYVDTDMTAAEILFFGKSVLKCDLANMNMMTMPGNLTNSYYVMNRDAVLSILNTKFNDAYEGDIPGTAFDANQLFNNPSNYNINYAYNLPAEQVFDNTVFNGADVDENGVDLPWNGYYQ